MEDVLKITNLLKISSSRSVPKTDRSPISEQNAAEAKETPNEFYEAPDRRTRETFPQTKVPGLSGKSGSREVAEDDGCAGENVVPEQTNEMEVSVVRFYRIHQKFNTRLVDKVANH